MSKLSNHVLAIACALNTSFLALPSYAQESALNVKGSTSSFTQEELVTHLKPIERGMDILSTDGKPLTAADLVRNGYSSDLIFVLKDSGTHIKFSKSEDPTSGKLTAVLQILGDQNQPTDRVSQLTIDPSMDGATMQAVLQDSAKVLLAGYQSATSSVKPKDHRLPAFNCAVTTSTALVTLVFAIGLLAHVVHVATADSGGTGPRGKVALAAGVFIATLATLMIGYDTCQSGD